MKKLLFLLALFTSSAMAQSTIDTGKISLESVTDPFLDTFKELGIDVDDINLDSLDLNLDCLTEIDGQEINEAGGSRAFIANSDNCLNELKTKLLSLSKEVGVKDKIQQFMKTNGLLE